MLCLVTVVQLTFGSCTCLSRKQQTSVVCFLGRTTSQVAYGVNNMTLCVSEDSASLTKDVTRCGYNMMYICQALALQNHVVTTDSQYWLHTLCGTLTPYLTEVTLLIQLGGFDFIVMTLTLATATVAPLEELTARKPKAMSTDVSPLVQMAVTCLLCTSIQACDMVFMAYQPWGAGNGTSSQVTEYKECPQDTSFISSSVVHLFIHSFIQDCCSTMLFKHGGQANQIWTSWHVSCLCSHCTVK